MPPSDLTRHLRYEEDINQVLFSDPLLRDEGGTAIRLCGQPLYLSSGTIQGIKKAAELIWSALERAVSHVAALRKYHPHFRRQGIFADINNIARAYPRSLYQCRFDFRLGQAGD